MSESESVRLAKRLAEQEQCSRREAELHITAGNVQVDGKVVQLPETRVRPEQQVTLRSGAQPEAVPPVTLLMNKPAGYTQGRPYGRVRSAHSLLGEASMAQVDTPMPLLVLAQHFKNLESFLPLPLPASGLIVYTQDKRVARKLGEEGMWLEQECIVGVEGQIHEDGLELMKAGLPIGKRQLPPCRVSWQNENHLRFALKGIAPDEIDAMCTEVGLRVVSLRRLRIGRLSLAKVPEGQWRYLMPWERF
ncbi:MULTISPECIES: S4 domain-containing protein [Burkholderiales]|jgi:23S rRNA pseudouridine2604 synthase|uniref:Dual-specificity RNA pseudouridine synthase RluF n=5 Tax=Pseudomonadati TaxID=3379134 RepID=A9BUI7_DELAS|nr:MULTISPECIES: S4 domain-containing protein [Burkholderiales]KAA9178890.1 RNA-binding protein [Delftia sp. BR1]OLE92437.1 MAG: RNA-binding protein [Delftia sp. 13_1_40CM_3_66_6]PIF39662.1 23S rRNA pseudouridine2604 synthase [Burkholderiales bacterium 23]ABX34095.1 RNA-binding S4 domain protein [Delftia acidovorans SPH-1]AEF92051.1 RNA-binding S4 domain protein [Delftia sp. Cs1-4]